MRRKLNLEQLQAICQGAVRAEENEEGIRFYRFTNEQQEYYRQSNEGFYRKSLASAGMKMQFETDSQSLTLKVHVEPGSTRTYFSFDVAVNGKMMGHLDNFSHVEVPALYTTMQLPLGKFSKSFDLGHGVKTVSIWLPWSVAVEIRELSVDEQAFVKPVRPEKKLLVFGDSITQGYDALRPSNRYASRLAEALGAEEVNKGIGAERFCPELAKLRDDFQPDYILAAYGTNDWKHREEAEFVKQCKAFYETLTGLYPDSRIFALTPIWRKNHLEPSPFGDFSNVAADIKEITDSMDHVIYLDGFEFVPHDSSYFADGNLHPNDQGFEQYFKGLWNAVSAAVQCEEKAIRDESVKG